MEIAPVLELKNISKSFGDKRVLSEVGLDVYKGEVQAVIGENGAGKSTLMKIAYGQHHADVGTLKVKGQDIDTRRHSPSKSIGLGLGMVHQHFMLVGRLTVFENLCLGNEPTRFGLIDKKSIRDSLEKISDRFSLDIDLDRKVDTLSVGEKQRVEIARVLLKNCDIIILDEPTAVLSPVEVKGLFELFRTLAKEGCSLVLITHKIDEICELANRASVLRQGKISASFELRPDVDSELNKDVTPELIANAIVGKQAPSALIKNEVEIGDVLLAADRVSFKGDLGGDAINSLSFDLKAGEILGIAGVMGNGQSELTEGLIGMQSPTSGAISLCGQKINAWPTRKRYKEGLGFVSEDRHEVAVLLEESVEKNFLFARQNDFGESFGRVDHASLRSRAKALVDEFDVRPKDVDLKMKELSGGNQQKVVMARELDRPGLKVLICSEPTRGVDIGAIDLIHKALLKAREKGVAVLLISSELKELLTLSDRLLVLYKGKSVQTFDRQECSQEGVELKIAKAMTGAS